jgi:hypothetical protein
VQFGVPASNYPPEPKELPVSDEQDEQPLKDSWWQNDGNGLQQSVHVPSRETVQPAYYRAQSDPNRTDRRTQPAIRRLPPI